MVDNVLNSASVTGKGRVEAMVSFFWKFSKIYDISRTLPGPQKGSVQLRGPEAQLLFAPWCIHFCKDLGFTNQIITKISL